MVSLLLIVDIGQKIQLQGMNHGSLEEGITLWLFVTWLWKPCMAHRNDDNMAGWWFGTLILFFHSVGNNNPN